MIWGRYLFVYTQQGWWSFWLSGTVIYSVSTWYSVVVFFMTLRTDLNIVFNRYKTACRSGLTMFTFHYYSLLLIEWIILHGWKLVHCMGLCYNIKTNIFFYVLECLYIIPPRNELRKTIPNSSSTFVIKKTYYSSYL